MNTELKTLSQTENVSETHLEANKFPQDPVESLARWFVDYKLGENNALSRPWESMQSALESQGVKLSRIEAHQFLQDLEDVTDAKLASQVYRDVDRVSHKKGDECFVPDLDAPTGIGTINGTHCAEDINSNIKTINKPKKTVISSSIRMEKSISAFVTYNEGFLLAGNGDVYEYYGFGGSLPGLSMSLVISSGELIAGEWNRVGPNVSLPGAVLGLNKNKEGEWEIEGGTQFQNSMIGIFLGGKIFVEEKPLYNINNLAR